MEPRYYRVMRGTETEVVVEGQSVRLRGGDYFSVGSPDGSSFTLFCPCTKVWPYGSVKVDDMEIVDSLVASGVVEEVPKNCHRQEQIWRGKLRVLE